MKVRWLQKENKNNYLYFIYFSNLLFDFTNSWIHLCDEIILLHLHWNKTSIFQSKQFVFIPSLCFSLHIRLKKRRKLQIKIEKRVSFQQYSQLELLGLKRAMFAEIAKYLSSLHVSHAHNKFQKLKPCLLFESGLFEFQ